MRRALPGFALAALTIAVSFVLLVALRAADGFAWKEAPGGKLRLIENGRHVLDYNFGPQLMPGVPEDRRREGYIYPLFSPAGVNPLDDFPKDHFHHRGVFWAWMSIGFEGKTYDLWTLKPGIEHRFHKFLKQSASANAASLRVENGWYVGNRLIVRETVDLAVPRSGENERNVDLAVRLDAVTKDVVIAGSPDDAKGYGGLCVRFGPRDETRILTPEGPVTANENEVPHAWAAMEALFSGKRAGLRVSSDPSNPRHPPGWCLRPYGFVGANFPGLQPYTLAPGQPLLLRYRVTVYDGTRP